MKMIKLNQGRNLPLIITLKSPKDKLCIATQKGQDIIPKSDINFLKADSNYCFIHSNGRRLLCSQSLKSLEARIQLPRFIKVHKSYVVNFDKIKFIDRSYSFITMEDGIEVPIARARKSIVKTAISNQFN